jgi:hypothetical protein
MAVIVVSSASIILMGILVVVAARRSGPLKRARHEATAALCSRHGLVPGAVPGDFPLLGAMVPNWLSNSFSSRVPQVAIADFIRPAGKNTQLFTVLGFTVPGVNIPYVAVARRELTGTVIGGPPAVELESIEFDKRFNVKAKDRRSAVMLLDPAMMQLVLDCEQVSFVMSGARVLAYINRFAEPGHKLAEPVEFEVLLKFLDGFVSRVPELLRTEYAAAGA